MIDLLESGKPFGAQIFDSKKEKSKGPYKGR
jgi:hypothetical protein